MDQYKLKGAVFELNFACYHTIDKETSDYGVHPDDLLESHPTWQLNGNTYMNVVKMTFNQYEPLTPEKAPVYYYARNVGLIRCKIYDEAKS